MELSLEKKKIIITGSSRGIGLAIADSFLREKASVCLTAKNKDNLMHAKHKLEKKYGREKILAFACDFTNLDEVEKTKVKIKKIWKGFDFLVLNIGSGKGKPLVIPKIKDLKKSFDQNFFSSMYPLSCFQSLINPFGSIIFISSIAGEEFLGAPIEYSVAKSSIISLAKNLSWVCKNNIRVNVISPGNIFFKGGTWDKKKKKNPSLVKKILKEKVPLQRFGKPEEVANLVTYICSEKASFINGAVIRIDGGQTIKI